MNSGMRVGYYQRTEGSWAWYDISKARETRSSMLPTHLRPSVDIMRRAGNILSLLRQQGTYACVNASQGVGEDRKAAARHLRVVVTSGIKHQSLYLQTRIRFSTLLIQNCQSQTCRSPVP